ncbi:MAG: hypothetical protein GWO24_20765, partial [Akkermansiaceae bacterium]|nr:hypothetical protein [Akkermansiaceae bacterium]
MIKLDAPKLGKETVAEGSLYWLPDGLVAVQGGAEEEHQAYYLVEAPRESDPRVTLRESSMTLRVSTDEGMRTISYSVDRSEGSKVVLFTFKNYFREALELEGELEVVENFVEVGGEGAS